MKRKLFGVLLTAFALCLAWLPGHAQDREMIYSMKAQMAQEGMQFLAQMDSGIAGLDPEADTLIVRDWSGKETAVISLSECIAPEFECSGMAACTEAPDDGWYALFVLNELSDEPMLALCRLSPDGHCLWSTAFVQRPQWGWTLLASTQDGVLLLHVCDTDSRESVLRYVSQEGKLQWKKKLAFDGLAYSPFAADSHEGNTVRIYGTAVSVSKGTYAAVELDVSGGGEVTAEKAWDFAPVTRDYAARLQLDPRRHAVELLWNEGAAGDGKRIALDTLSECTPPSWALTDVDADVH